MKIKEMQTNKSERISYFDIAKGVAIFSVVVYHIAEIMGLTDVMDFINTYFLSVFFLISGYFTYGNSFKSSNVRAYIKKSVAHLLLPFFIFSLLNNLFQAFLFGGRSLVYLEDPKGGYWFLLALFYFQVLIKLLHDYILVRLKSVFIRLLLIILPFMIVVLLNSFIPENIWHLLSLSCFRRFYLIFVAGYILKMLNYETIKAPINLVCAILYILGCYFFVDRMTEFTSNVDFLLWLFINTFGSLTLLYLSCVFDRYSPKLGGGISAIGRASLGIYVIHFFYKQLFKYLSNSVSAWCESNVLTCLIISIIVLIISYYTYRLLSRNKLIAKYCFGEL